MTGPDLVGRRVRFAPNPRWPDRAIEAHAVRIRGDRHIQGARQVRSSQGWLDTIDDAGVERSVRPSRCEVVRCIEPDAAAVPARASSPRRGQAAGQGAAAAARNTASAASDVARRGRQ